VAIFEILYDATSTACGASSTACGVSIATIRGKPYGALSLSRTLGLSDSAEESKTRQGVLTRDKGTTVCLFVDRVIGRRKVVVNTLSDALPRTNKIEGVAQLGGSDLALALKTTERLTDINRAVNLPTS